MTDALDALPAGFSLPGNTPPAVVTAIFWALGQLGTPYSFGGSCTDPHSGDPSKRCDCSCLVILSRRLSQGCDRRERVADTVVHAAVADTLTRQAVGWTVTKLQSRRPLPVSLQACDGERVEVPR